MLEKVSKRKLREKHPLGKTQGSSVAGMDGEYFFSFPLKGRSDMIGGTNLRDDIDVGHHIRFIFPKK